MGYLWRMLEWIGLCLGIVIAALAMSFAIARRRVLRHVREELGQDALLLVAGARVGERHPGGTRHRPPWGS